MRRLTSTLTLALVAAGFLVAIGAAQAQQPRHMQSRASAPQADASKAGGGENCGTPDEPKACPPLPRNNLTEFPRNRTQ